MFCIMITQSKKPLSKWVRSLIIAFLCLLPFSMQAQISFLSQDVITNLTSPTTLQFGPDGRLYVAQQDGLILIYTINRVGSGNYQVTGTETINLINTGTPNHNDDGSANSTQQRQVTGLMVLGTAQNPVLYVSSSDWRTAVGNDVNLDTNSGILSRLTWNGSSWSKVDIVRGFPRSEENHSVNGMDYDPATNTIYLMVGGITNKGAPGNNFAGTPEYVLSAALVSIDMNVINSLPVYTDPRNNSQFVYDIPTLDDPSRANITNTHPDFPYQPGHPMYNQSIDPGDPFGGNNGLNQARWVTGGPVQVYSGGWRNAYDVVFSSKGKLYSYDNGPNGGWGGLPLIYAADGTPKGTGPADWQNGDYASNEFNESSSDSYWDHLHYIAAPGYYAGHPNPTRANPEKSKLYEYDQSGSNWNLINTYDFFTDFPDPPVEMALAQPYEAEYLHPDVNGSLEKHWASTNGLVEYTASNFDSAMTGDLLAAAFNDIIMRIDLDETGTQSLNQSTLVSGGDNPLDVTAQGDNQIFPGTIWVAVHGGGMIKVFEPSDYDGSGSVCTGDDDIALDEDNDGYSNADEIDNGTDPCSQGSVPPDYDGDLISDLNDPDDDNDGLLDTYDPFAVDAQNGLGTDLNVLYGFSINNGEAIPGTLFGLGFTGVMTNGDFVNSTPGDDYQSFYDELFLNLGGAASKLGVEDIGPGTAEGNNNDQHNAFQFGLNVDTNTDAFSIHSEVESPYFLVNGNPITPIDYQSMGIYLGNGDQDNYLKIALNAQGGAGGVEVVLEVNGSIVSSTNYGTATVGNILSSTATDLYLQVDPASLTVQPQMSIDGGANVVSLGSPIAIPASWLDPNDNFGLAMGVISTSFGSATPFDATWDYIDIVFDQPYITQTFADISTVPGTAPEMFDLDNYFGDNAGTINLTYSVTGNTDTLIGADIVGNQLTITYPDTSANSDITIRATDQGGLFVEQTFNVDVNDLPTVLYRVNAGGNQLTSLDAPNPDWESDAVSGATQYHNSSSNTSTHTSPNRDGTVPSYIPQDLFNTERWDHSSGEEMKWFFNVSEPATYEVRLYFANGFAGTSQAGQRVFNVEIEGIPVLTNYDIAADVGHQTGTMKSFTVAVSDGSRQYRLLSRYQ